MTDFDRKLEDLERRRPALGGYVQHPNPKLEPHLPYEDDAFQDAAFQEPAVPDFVAEFASSEPQTHDAQAAWQQTSAAPGWQTASYAPQEQTYSELGYSDTGYQEETHSFVEHEYEHHSYPDQPYQVPEVAEGGWGAGHEPSVDHGPPVYEETSWEMPTAPGQHDFDATPAGVATRDRDSTREDADTNTDSKKSGMGASAVFIGFLCLAVVVVGAAAFFALKLADSEPEGPASPEAAVAVMLEALAAEDALGMAESILPSERESLIDPTLALVEELKRVGLLSSDTDLNNISGVDITTNALTMEIEEIDSQIRWVTMNGGTITSNGSGDGLPVSESEISADINETVDFSVDPVSFAVVEENGSWYPSIWYTIAETARREADLPRPTLSRQPTGSRTPGEAVARFVNAAADMRPSEMLTALDPVEMRAAYDYSSLFISDLDSAALELRRDIRSDGSTWNLASLDTSVTEAGDKAIVSIDGFVITGTQGLTEPFAVTLDEGCLTLEGSGQPESVCRGEDGFPDIATNMRVVERDGLWFVSAAPNLIYPYVDYLRTLETDSVASFGDLIDSALDSAFNSAELSFSPIDPQPSQAWTAAYTVDQFIPAGTPASEIAQFLVLEDIPSELVPGTAIVNLGQISGLEAAFDIEPGTILVAPLLREAALDPSLTDPDPDPASTDPNSTDPNSTDPDAPVEAAPTPEPSIAEPVEADLFPAGAVWLRVDSSTSAVFDINFDAREPLWVAERIDGSVTIQITKLADSRETRALEFSEFWGWQRARNIEYPAYANSQYAVVVVGNYLVVSLDPLDDSGILLEQARYLAKQIR